MVKQRSGNAVGALLIATGLAVAGYSGYRTVVNIDTNLEIDKRVNLNVKAAGYATSAQQSEDHTSMEEYLQVAGENIHRWDGVNSAIFFKSNLYDGEFVGEVFDDAAIHAHDLGLLEQALAEGELPEGSPKWVQLAYENTAAPDGHPELAAIYHDKRAATFATAYEMFNDTVSGGSYHSGEGTTRNEALVTILEDASDSSFVNLYDVDVIPMRNAWGHAHVSLAYANMGKLDKTVEHLKAANAELEKFPGDVDLAVFREDLPAYSMEELRGNIDSAISEFEALDNYPEDQKYMQGWWNLVQKKAETLGAEEVNLGEMSDRFSNGYAGRAGWAALFTACGLGLMALGAGTRRRSSRTMF